MLRFFEWCLGFESRESILGFESNSATDKGSAGGTHMVPFQEAPKAGSSFGKDMS